MLITHETFLKSIKPIDVDSVRGSLFEDMMGVVNTVDMSVGEWVHKQFNTLMAGHYHYKEYERTGKDIPCVKVPYFISQPLGKTHLSIPCVWLEVLRAVKSICGENVNISGGSLRDLFHDRWPKDVDIFCCPRGAIGDPDTLKSGDDPTIIMNLLTISLGLPRSAFTVRGSAAYDKILGRHVTVPTGEGESKKRKFAGIVNFVYEGFEFEVILARDIEAWDYKRFDINICQIATDGNMVFTTKDFRDGVREKTLKVCYVDRKDGQVDRMRRMGEKYPEYKVFDSK